MTDDTEYRFDQFRLEPGRRLLLEGNEPMTIGSRAFDVLYALVRRRGELATKAELMNEVWPNVVVEENNLTTQIVTLRKLLREAPPDRRFIATVPGRGYRFVWPVAADGAAPSPAPAPAPAAEAPASALPAHNLPAEPNSFIGRQREIAEIATRLAARPLVSVVGSGGIGKTRLALRLGRQVLPDFPDGVWFVDLAPLADPAQVPETLCRVLGLPLSGERPPTEIALTFLREKRLLVILDNCEHVLAAAAPLASALLAQCAGVKLLATSRAALGIHGETVFRLPSLPLPDPDPNLTAEAALRSEAVRLFVERAADAAGGFTLTDADAPAVAAICRRLDGVAMATELAAARLRLLKPAEIAARLEDVFRLLTGGSKSALPRQQTLRATIDWSHNLLSAHEQIALRRLSVFVDGFTLEAATAVAACDPIDEFEILDLLDGLVDKSLVAADLTGETARYRMLETTRQYGREKLEAAGESDTALHRFAADMAAFCTRAERSWAVTATEPWLAEYGPDIENVRAAIEWAFGLGPGRGAPGDPSLGLILVAHVGSLAEEMSLQADMRRWTRAAVHAITPSTPPGTEAWVLFWANRHQGMFGDTELKKTRNRVIALFREAGDVSGLACALRTAALADARIESEREACFAMMQEAASLLRPRGPSKDLAGVLMHLGSLHYFDGNYPESYRLNEEALAIRTAIGDRTGVLSSYINLAELEAARGNPERAIEFATRGVAEAGAASALGILSVTMFNLAGYWLAVDNAEEGLRCALDALRLNLALGYEDYVTICLEHAALAWHLLGRSELAAELFGFTDSYYRRTGQVRCRLEESGANRLRAALDEVLSVEERETCIARGAGWTETDAERAASGWGRPDETEPRGAETVSAR